METIDTLNISSTSKGIYKNALKRHLDGIDLNDFESVSTVLKTKSKPTRLVLLTALHHITKKEKYAEMKAEEDQKYKSDLMGRRKNDPIEIEWDEKAKEIKERRQKNKGNRELHGLYVWVLLMKYHPRRFRDYHLMSVEAGNNSVNFYDRQAGTITFNVFKTSKKKTSGEKVVVPVDEVRHELNEYIDEFNIESLLFPVNEQRIRYLMRTHKVPLCNQNRKFQETRDIQNGKSHYETAQKYNHSIQAQMVYYVSIQGSLGGDSRS
jgi:hypothetical protein